MVLPISTENVKNNGQVIAIYVDNNVSPFSQGDDEKEDISIVKIRG